MEMDTDSEDKLEQELGIDFDNFPTRETAKDMLSMVSPVYDRSYVGKWMYEIMSISLEKARRIVDDLANQIVPETATWTLAYWEQSYGIVTNEALSIEERRRAIVRKRSVRRPMNPARIEMLLSEVCGRDVRLKENVAPHTFEIEILGDGDIDLDRLFDLLDEIKQSQKSYRVVFDVDIEVQIRIGAKKQVFPYRLPGNGKKAGRWPQPYNVGIVARPGVTIRPNGRYGGFPYVPAGTRPDVSTPGALRPADVEVWPAGEDRSVPYVPAGTRPDVNTVGRLENAELELNTEADAQEFAYYAAREDRKTGTIPDVSTQGRKQPIDIEAATAGRGAAYPYRLTGEEQKTGVYPDVSTTGRTERMGVEIDPDTVSADFPYQPADKRRKSGQYPDTGTIGAIRRADIEAEATGRADEIMHPAAGTMPDVSTAAELEDMKINADTESSVHVFADRMADKNRKTGSAPDVSTVMEKPDAKGVNAGITTRQAGIVHKVCGSKRL